MLADIFCCYLCVFNVNFVPPSQLPRKVGVINPAAPMGAPPLAVHLREQGRALHGARVDAHVFKTAH